LKFYKLQVLQVESQRRNGALWLHMSRKFNIHRLYQNVDCVIPSSSSIKIMWANSGKTQSDQ